MDIILFLAACLIAGAVTMKVYPPGKVGSVWGLLLLILIYWFTLVSIMVFFELAPWLWRNFMDNKMLHGLAPKMLAGGYIIGMAIAMSPP